VIDMDGLGTMVDEAKLIEQFEKIPTPTQGYTEHLAKQASRRRVTGGAPRPKAGPVPAAPIPTGARVLMWKQDPSVSEIGIRKAYLPGRVLIGPKDARITIQGVAPVQPNVFGDMVIDPVTMPEAFDAVHTFAVIRQTLTMYERHLTPKKVPWQWNTGGNVDPLSVFPRAGVTQNAFYSRSMRALKFFFFDTTQPPPLHTVFTCRSFDIVAHEAGHAILDGLKPGWLSAGNPPQTGGLHESFGDLTAMFLALSQLDQCEAVIAQTKANLHDKNFLSDLAEQFGSSLGRPNGLRNADNDLKLSQVGNEVHAISQVFTGGVYDVMADIFVLERNAAKRDDASVLYSVGRYMASLVIRAIIAAPAIQATYADVVNKMLAITIQDGKPAAYRNSIVNRFSLREVITPLKAELAAHEDVEVAPEIEDEPGAVQDRSRCCGTMQHEEYLGETDALEEELKRLESEFVETNGAGTTRAKSKSTAKKTTAKKRTRS
jgi:hypothetical protein